MKSLFKIPKQLLEANRSEVLFDINRTSQLLDVTIVNEKQEFYAHKLMLATASPIFRKILVGAGDRQALLYLRGTKCEIIEAMLNFIYTGEARVPTPLLNEFIVFGNEMKIFGFGMSELKASFDKQVPLKANEKEYACPPNKRKKIQDIIELDDEEVICDNTRNNEVSSGNIKCKDCPQVFKEYWIYRNHLPCLGVITDNIFNGIDVERDNTTNNPYVTNNFRSLNFDKSSGPSVSVDSCENPKNVEREYVEYDEKECKPELATNSHQSLSQ